MNTSSSHPFDPETIVSFLDGELPASDASSVAAHLGSCSDCSSLAAKTQSVSTSLAKWQVEILPAKTGEAASLQRKVSSTVFLNNFLRLRSPFNKILLATATVGAFALLLIVVAVPNLVRSKMAANEASAVGTLRTLNSANASYGSQYGHLPQSLQNLAPPSQGAPHADAAGLVDPSTAAGSKSGYRFSYQPYGDHYTIRAEAIDPEKTGARSFSTDDSGTVFVDGKPLDGDAESAKKFSTFSPSAPKTLHSVMIARTAELSIVVKDFASARASLDALLIRHRGYAGQLVVSGDPSSNGSLQATLHVPTGEANAFIVELKSLGRVERESQSGEEVTMQHADLVARIANSRETEARLKEILRTRTGKVADVLEVEQQISLTRGQIEQMEAELKALETRVDFGSISLSFSTEFKERLGVLSPSAAVRIQNAFVSGYRDARESLIEVVVWLLSTGPSLFLLILILALPIRWVWHRWRSSYSSVKAA